MTFADRLREHRKPRMTVTELSALTGLSRQSLTLLESGESKPSWESVCKIADALGLTPNDFRDPD